MIKLIINWGLSSTIDQHDCDWLNQRKQRGPGWSKNLPLKFCLGRSGPRSIVCGSPRSRHRIGRCSTRLRRQKERTSSLPNNPFPVEATEAAAASKREGRSDALVPKSKGRWWTCGQTPRPAAESLSPSSISSNLVRLLSPSPPSVPFNILPTIERGSEARWITS